MMRVSGAPMSSIEESARDSRQIAFESIGVSIWKNVERLTHGGLAALQLVLSYFQLRSASLARRTPDVHSILQELGGITDKAVHFLRKDYNRYALIAAIGILDSFLSDALHFLFLHKPDYIPHIRPRKAAERLDEFAERILRTRELSSYRRRLELLTARLDVQIEAKQLEDLALLVKLRNEVVHHGGLFRFRLHDVTGDVWAEPRPLPEVPREQAMNAAMLVSEICDVLLTAMSKQLFGKEPSVRPMTPEVEAAHAHVREQWASSRSSLPQVENHNDPRWSVNEDADTGYIWVGDSSDVFWVSPTGIDVLPALISFRRNDMHGKTARVTVDNNRPLELSEAEHLLPQMLAGKEVLVEFHEEPHDEPSFARFSLRGFPEAWLEASRRRAQVKLKS
jgi:hypothetical protein